MKRAFKPFYFNGNQFFGHVKTPEDIKMLLSCYDYNTIRKAQVKDIGLSDFGFYAEYNGNLTLGEWIDKNNLGIFFDIKSERKEKLNKLFDES